MKKRVKKLELSKETLQKLNPEFEGMVVGGSGTVLCTTAPFRYCPREINTRLDC